MSSVVSLSVFFNNESDSVGRTVGCVPAKLLPADGVSVLVMGSLGGSTVEANVIGPFWNNSVKRTYEEEEVNNFGVGYKYNPIN